jgi:hypothetical protein
VRGLDLVKPGIQIRPRGGGKSQRLEQGGEGVVRDGARSASIIGPFDRQTHGASQVMKLLRGHDSNQARQLKG